MLLIPKLINFAFFTINKLGIDESHGLSHSLNVLHHSHNILESEIPLKPYLEEQRDIIYTSAIVHDLCDKKYINEKNGIDYINSFLLSKTTLLPNEINVVKKIISTISYSKVKVDGFPSMGKYEMAYHIVREADLLSAYDINRSIIYNMNQVNSDFEKSLQNALHLFDSRVLQHNRDYLFVTNYSKQLSKKLEIEARKDMDYWKLLVKESGEF